ncbi:7-cyano-7-deazaguanine synthase (EC [Desulfovibrio diazotrophicus]|nr:7-cyano-7-deazaguanine synthase (EC [Desulfovibrio diazotrophicus]VVU42691.1 7-cyano-7-deazaguanine synthase (EC [Desulfovibrio diazotrophicus]
MNDIMKNSIASTTTAPDPAALPQPATLPAPDVLPDMLPDMLADQQALVVFSGGQDSATCLAWALSRFGRVQTLGFDYGQRHVVELSCRQALREGLSALNPQWAARLGPDTLLRLDIFRDLANTALTSDAPIEEHGPDGLPNTFVPGRNLIFILHAAAWAYSRDIRHLVLGVCQSDYSGYPDCRDDSIKAMQVAVNTGMDTAYVLHTPLMWRSKKDAWTLAEQLGGERLVDLIVERSHTCYLGTRGERHPWGYGCGSCPACRLRAAGYTNYVRAKAGTGPGAQEGTPAACAKNV